MKNNTTKKWFNSGTLWKSVYLGTSYCTWKVLLISGLVTLTTILAHLVYKRLYVGVQVVLKVAWLDIPKQGQFCTGNENNYYVPFRVHLSSIYELYIGCNKNQAHGAHVIFHIHHRPFKGVFTERLWSLLEKVNKWIFGIDNYETWLNNKFLKKWEFNWSSIESKNFHY